MRVLALVILVSCAFPPAGLHAQLVPADAPPAESVEDLAAELRSIIYPQPISRGDGSAPPKEVVVMNSIQFEFASDALTPRARMVLNTLAQALNVSDIRESDFLIEGHTDAVGSASANLELSERRAESVIKYLESRGVAEGRLKPRGLGESQPIEPVAGRSAINRRVEIRVDKDGR